MAFSAEEINQINSWDCETFVNEFGNIIEHFPVLAGGLYSNRPFKSFDHLYENVKDIVDSTPFVLKEGMLRVHPDLAGHLADAGILTNESKEEQKSAGLDNLTPEERSTIRQLNNAYKSKFSFPFVVCARENKKEAIMNGMRSRLENSPEQETLTGVEEIKKICYYRLCDIVERNNPSKL